MGKSIPSFFLENLKILNINIAFPHNRCNDHAKEDVLPACQKTMKNLQIEYLDLYLVIKFLE